MLKKKPLSLAIASSLAAASCQWMIASEVYAASTDQAGGNAPMEEVVVTGSRIKNANVVSSSPVTVISGEEMALQGTVRVEDMLVNVPSVFEEQGTGQSNGSTGTATVNLRNLGSVRTLVLVNGRRLPAGSPLQGGIGADINQIPGALVKNVEILTGGASATDGSDAVAGVVNFIMKDDFEGVNFDAQYSFYQHDNRNENLQKVVAKAGFNVPDGSNSGGDISSYSLIMGGNLDSGRGNITAYVTYRNIQAVTQGDRIYSACALSNDATSCGGSSTVPWGRITDFANFDYSISGTGFVPFSKLYNYGPLNYFQRPDERYTGGVFAHYQVTDQMQAYMEVMAMDDRTVSQIAPSGNFYVTNTVHCDNPLLSASQLQALCTDYGLGPNDIQTTYFARRNVEGGDREQDLRHTVFRGVFGLRGDINDTWRYDVYGQYSEVAMANTYLNDLGITKIARAMDPILVNDASSPYNGQIVCRSVYDGTDPNCVPWNVWTEGAVTKAQTNYLSLPLYARGTTDQQVWSAYVAGNLGDYGIQFPSANQGIDLVLGAEYRQENLNFSPDDNFINGEGAGQGGGTTAVGGGYDVKEFFLESSIPVVQGAPGAQDVTLDVGYRYSDYSTDVTTNTYGLRGGWAVNNSVKVRASFQRAIRAANIRELFQPQGLNLFDMNADPCGGATPTATLAECQNSGVTAAQYTHIPLSPANQYNYLQGGNTQLKPEEADTWSVGVVFTPENIAHMILSVDYYDIKIKKVISNLDPEFILNTCVDSGQLCNNVVRSATLGDLWVGSNPTTSGHIIALNDNLAIWRVKGFDITGTYVLDINRWGSIRFSDTMGVVTTWDSQQFASAPVEDCKGNWNGTQCGYPTPDLRNVLRTTWTTPWNVDASLNWRYTADVKDLNGTRDLGSRNYFDLSGTWNVNDSVRLIVGCNNILDKAPPVAGGGAGPSIGGNGNVFPGAYDALGRYIFARVSLTH